MHISVRSISRSVASVSLPCNLVGYIHISEINEEMKKSCAENEEAVEAGLDPVHTLPSIATLVSLSKYIH
jgi:hypothetical protein